MILQSSVACFYLRDESRKLEKQNKHIEMIESLSYKLSVKSQKPVG